MSDDTENHGLSDNKEEDLLTLLSEIWHVMNEGRNIVPDMASAAIMAQTRDQIGKVLAHHSEDVRPRPDWMGEEIKEKEEKAQEMLDEAERELNRAILLKGTPAEGTPPGGRQVVVPLPDPVDLLDLPE